MRGVLETRSQLRPEFRSRVDARCVLEGPANALAQSAPRGEIGAAHWTRLYVPQDLVIRLCEELLGEKRIDQFANITALHGRWSQVSARRLPTADLEAPSCDRSDARPRWSRDITVPRGIASASAISLYVSPSTSQSTITS